ncbi:MAG: hypothetical protein LBS45_07075 [Synergistaceae bacterium]|jgi:hypothetical protein|nr:hypothetical protein [Synergistaceae bacterium]
MIQINGKDFWTAESSFGDKEYKGLCCEQCNRLWAARARKRKKSDRYPYYGACGGYLTENVLRILAALEAPCRYCGDVPWISCRPRDHVTISCENEDCSYYMSTDIDGGGLLEAEAVKRWNYLNTGKLKEPRIKAVSGVIR